MKKVLLRWPMKTQLLSVVAALTLAGTFMVPSASAVVAEPIIYNASASSSDPEEGLRRLAADGSSDTEFNASGYPVLYDTNQSNSQALIFRVDGTDIWYSAVNTTTSAVNDYVKLPSETCGTDGLARKADISTGPKFMATSEEFPRIVYVVNVYTCTAGVPASKPTSSILYQIGLNNDNRVQLAKETAFNVIYEPVTVGTNGWVFVRKLANDNTTPRSFQNMAVKPDLTVVTTAPSNKYDIHYSVNGYKVAYNKSVSGVQRIFVDSTNGSSSTMLANAADVYAVAINKNGSNVLYAKVSATNTTTWLNNRDVAAGTSTVVTSVPYGDVTAFDHVAWSFDNTSIAYAAYDATHQLLQISRVNNDGSSKTVLKTYPTAGWSVDYFYW